MPLTERRHLGRQQENIQETGVQVRSDDPVSPVVDQTWLNTTQNRLKYFDGTSKVVLVEGHIGAALEVPPSAIIDASTGRSWFKEVTSNYTINAFQNFAEGLTVFLKIANPNANVKEVTSITLPASTSIANGAYFLINGASNDNKYYVWMNFDALGTDPAIPNRSAIPVAATKGKPEIAQITCPSAGTIGSTGTYFLLSAANNTTQYYVWYNLDSGGGFGGGDPSLAGKTGIEVQITLADGASDVALKTKDAIDAKADFIADVAGTVVTVTNANVGPCDDAANVNVPGIIISTTQQGVSPDNAIQMAVKVAAALDAKADFDVPVPSSSTLVVTNADFGFTDDAVDGNIGGTFAVSVTTQGSGRITLILPSEGQRDEATNLNVDGGAQRIFRLFRSGSFVYAAPNGVFSYP